jgi:hypothetical protein
MDYSKTASRDSVEKTAAALKTNGNFDVIIVENGADARAKVLELIPAGAEVMTMTSITLDTIGLVQEINESGKFDSVKAKLAKMDSATHKAEMRRIGAAPEWAIGSAHAVTETGEVLIASNTGSQLPAYAYGAEKIVWVIGAQKIVADREAAMKRIYEYVLPLEGERANKAYNITSGSAVNKLLILNKENIPSRITVILVNEALGF